MLSVFCIDVGSIVENSEVYLNQNKLYLIFGDIVENSKEYLNQNKIYIIGTYYGGCGYSKMKKRKIVEEIKKNLIRDYFYPENNIVTSTVNLKGKESDQKFKIDGLKINYTEFNIFVFYKNKKYLVGTSYRELKEYFYEFLAGTIGSKKKSLNPNFIQKINKIIKEIDKSVV